MVTSYPVSNTELPVKALQLFQDARSDIRGALDQGMISPLLSRRDPVSAAGLATQMETDDDKHALQKVDWNACRPCLRGDCPL
jgi:hypothetical protein